MASSLLQGRRFYCREWAFSKINHFLDNRASSKTCGALIMGGPGCGKTALCCDMVWPTSTHGRQVALSKRVLAYYFCQAHDIETLSIANFIISLVEQISRSKLIQGFDEYLKEPTVQLALEESQCERNPDEAFKKGVLHPLSQVTQPSQNFFILVDSIDESYMQAISDRTAGSRTIAELLANHHQKFPDWLLLICSARKQSKSVTRMFTGFRKISLDDLRKSHVVRDVQQYILSRLDQEEELRQHLSRETAEMLNQLHIKSNGCFLYLEKVLDGVAENFIMLREIREIPGTLNGLYLWLCQRIFVKKQFAKIQPILNVILAARRPLTEEELYTCVFTRNPTLEYEEFQGRLELMSKILIDGRDATKILFHHSFAEWLLDVKHCTQKFLCVAAEGHGMLAMSFTLHARDLTPVEVQDFALHLVKSNLQPSVQSHHLALWMLQSGANIEESLRHGLPKEQEVVKLLIEAGAIVPTPDASTSQALAFPTEEEISMNAALESGVIDDVDASGRTMLATAAYNGNLDLINMLLGKGALLEVEDKKGQTALNLAARQGHLDVVNCLLRAGCEIDHADSDGWTPLRSAAWGGHTDVVGLLLSHSAEVDSADTDGRTALRAAAWGGHDDIVLKLLEYGAEVNKTDNEGRTALIAAAYMGHVEIVEHLLDHGADINHEDCDGRTALSVASLCVPASEGHAGVVSLLLDRGAMVNHCDKDGMTPLLVAAYEGHHEVCELLLEGDADVDHCDKNGRTPLQAAASMGHAAVVNLLLFWGAAVDTIDSEGRTVLCIASQQGSVDVVRQLLDRGLDEMHRDNNGWTPLHMAAFEGHKEVCILLVEAGARVNEIDNDGRIPMILAAQEGHLETTAALLEAGSPMETRAHDGKTSMRVAALEGHKDVVHYLLCQGADINYRDADGRSTLYVLALENHVAMAAFLLESGAHLESCDLEGRTALHVAAWQGHYEMVELLLIHGADVNAIDNDRRTALQSASWQGHTKIVRLLLERGADVDHTCNQGATALCIAAQEGHEDVVKVLLRFKANPNHADQYGRSATRVAVKGGHQSVVKILEEYGAQPLNGVGQRRSGSTSGSTSESGKQSNHLYCNVNIPNGQVSASPSESPWSTFDKRKSCNSSQMTKSASNLSQSNTSSTNQSSSSTQDVIDSPGMSFTQQLQQCSANKNRNRPLSRVLSPVSEPQSPINSPPGSPLSEIQSIRISPDQQSPASTKPTSPYRDNKAMYVMSNPTVSAHYPRQDDEPVWQRLSDLPAKADRRERQNNTSPSNKSPTESRKKRNGIVTNPNYAKGVNINGYFNKLANLPDNIDNYPVSNGNSSNASSSMPAKRAQRPNGLPLKKETPL